MAAALSARESGASVLLLEGAPQEFRGGNSRHTRNLRCMHEAPTDVMTDAYPEDEFYNDILRVTGGQTNEQLARMTIRGFGHLHRVDEWLRSPFSTRHGGHAAPGPHECVFPGRR